MSDIVHSSLAVSHATPSPTKSACSDRNSNRSPSGIGTQQKKQQQHNTSPTTIQSFFLGDESFVDNQESNNKSEIAEDKDSLFTNAVSLVTNLLERMDTSDTANEDGTYSSNDSTNDKQEPTVEIPLKELRSQIFRLSAAVGKLSVEFIDRDDTVHDYGSNKHRDNEGTPVSEGMVELVQHLMTMTDLLSVNLVNLIEMKMELNRKKYPVELCKGKANKYTEYSDQTGITREHGQVTLLSTTATINRQGLSTNNNTNEESGGMNPTSTSFIDMLPTLTSRIRQFAADRDWYVYHTPRNLLLALTGELGELAELVQFEGDHPTTDVTAKTLDKLGQEVADVAIYLLRLADICNINLYKQITTSTTA